MPRASYVLHNIPLCGTDFPQTLNKHYFWFVLDPCGVVCVLFTYAIHVICLLLTFNILLTNELYPTKSSKMVLFMLRSLYITFFALSLISHCRALSTDPGTVPLDAQPLAHMATSRKRQCQKCNDAYKPPRAHHDSISGRCIVKFDHFCPWVNNAIGIWNHKFFILFVFYTFLCGLLVLCVYCRSLIYCSASDAGTVEKDSARRLPGCGEVFYPNTYVLLVLTVLFTLFTFLMLIDQVSSVLTGVSKIDRMQVERERESLRIKEKERVRKMERIVRERRDKSMEEEEDDYNNVGDEEDVSTVTTSDLSPPIFDFNEIFGGTGTSVRLDWFLPTHIQFDPSIAHFVRGYVLLDDENSKAISDIENGGGVELCTVVNDSAGGLVGQGLGEEEGGEEDTSRLLVSKNE